LSRLQQGSFTSRAARWRYGHCKNLNVAQNL
jgi:hypothetical protein